MMKVKHPAVLQLRGNYEVYLERVLCVINNYECWVDRRKEGVDIYFSDVNDARKALSKIKKLGEVSIKMSTKYAGLRRGRVRVFFVYSLKF